MERETGIEPATSSLGSWHSTAELLPLLMKSAICKKTSNLPKRHTVSLVYAVGQNPPFRQQDGQHSSLIIHPSHAASSNAQNYTTGHQDPQSANSGKETQERAKE